MKKPSKKSNKSPLFIYDKDGLIEHSYLPFALSMVAATSLLKSSAPEDDTSHFVLMCGSKSKQDRFEWDVMQTQSRLLLYIIPL